MAQEAVLRAWRMRRSCRSRDPSAWLRRIAYRESLRAIARDRECTPLATADEPADLDGGVEALPELVDLGAARAALEPLDRRLIALRYDADMTQAAIAELLGMPEGTVKVRLHRARRALAERMDRR
jgi:RNA polymerase sigma-70 factor (ECF subfamily)